MGCGGGAKSTSSTVRQVPRPATEMTPKIAPKRPPPNPRRKLEPEILDGFAKIFRRFYERQKVEEKQQRPTEEYRPAEIVNQFGSMLREEKQSAIEEKRHSPEPPRPESDSEETYLENESARAECLERERQLKEEADKHAAMRRQAEEVAAGKTRLISGLANEASSILSKYQ